MDLLQELHKNPFVLAPMAAITDCAFRSFMREMGCGAVITELVSANGLQYSSERTRKIMKFQADQHPVGIQLFGERLDALALAAKEVEQMGADFVDLNFGCPVPKVVNKGAGSALLKDLVQMQKVLRTVKDAVTIPVTIKIRSGWNQEMRNADEVAQLAFDEGIAWMGIHGRTRSQGYNGQADWDYIAWVKSVSKIPILGNGDITTAELAVRRLKESRCDGVMIGRGCLKNPWIFQQAMALYQDQPLSQTKDLKFVLDRLRFHLAAHADERIAMLQIKKFASWFSTGYPGAAQFRKQVFQIKDRTELDDTVEAFFEKLNNILQADTSHEPFLMGGHG